MTARAALETAVWAVALFATFAGLPILAAVVNAIVTGQPSVWAGWPF